MTKLTFNTIQAGEKVIIDNMGMKEQVLFLGFSDVDVKYGDGGAVFNNLKEVKAKYNLTNAKELEDIGDSLGLDYGHNIYALFYSDHTGDDGYGWAAYLFKGRWCCGSSAVPVKLIERVK